MQRNADKLPDTPTAEAVRVLLAKAAPILEMIRNDKAITVKKGAAPKPPTAIYTAPVASGTVMAAALAELRGSQ